MQTATERRLGTVGLPPPRWNVEQFATQESITPTFTSAFFLNPKLIFGAQYHSTIVRTWFPVMTMAMCERYERLTTLTSDLRSV